MLVALSVLACRKPVPIDPAEEAFHRAVTQFAEVSKLTQDLTYRDPRFDPILDALDQIPVGTDAKPRAVALAERIRGARTLANSQERTSELLQAQAEAPPAFQPQARFLSAPPPKPSAMPEARAGQGAPGPVESGGGVAIARTPGKLPAWYANYFGGADKVEDGGAPQADATAVTAPDAPPPPRRTPNTESTAPPPVFGLPGPAGGALQGRPGSE
jgi:hypothetical protein